MLVVFFFKQKTAYEMRISDWSSDVLFRFGANVPRRRPCGRHLLLYFAPKGTRTRRSTCAVSKSERQGWLPASRRSAARRGLQVASGPSGCDDPRDRPNPARPLAATRLHGVPFQVLVHAAPPPYPTCNRFLLYVLPGPAPSA